jgi:hypothetical protein
MRWLQEVTGKAILIIGDEIMKVRCPKCRKVFNPEDIVIIDFMYTVTHFPCYDAPLGLVQDSGPFQEIAEKHLVSEEENA